MYSQLRTLLVILSTLDVILSIHERIEHLIV